jgi:outer membrane protein
MKTVICCACAAIALWAWPISLSAQSGTHAKDPKEAARQEALIKEALARYDSGLEALRAPALQTPVGQPAPGGVKELRLEEAVALALDKNLDIQVQRLDPQVVDLQIAQYRNAYHPIASSTIGRANNYQLPRTSLVGGNQVYTDTNTYNAALTQFLPKFGGNASVTFNNSKVFSTANNVLFSPAYQAGLTASLTQPLLRNFQIDNTRQQLVISQINREVSEESLRAVVTQTLANVRNAYWDLVFARSAVDVARRTLSLSEKLVEDNQARVEVGTLAPIDVVQAQAEAANNRQTLATAEATLQTAELELKSFLVSGTEDPLWRQELHPVDIPSLEPAPSDIEAAVRNALGKRTDLITARRNLDSNDVSIKYFHNQALPAIDFVASYGAQGIGGLFTDRSGTTCGQVNCVVPGGYGDALSLLTARDYPTWNAQVNITYNIGANAADAQYQRARVQRSQSTTRLRSLELQVATEVTNAALQVQSNLKRVDAARAARELAQKRLEAEQSKFEVGMSTNFFVVQAQRDLASAENTELQAVTDYRKSLVTFERAQEAPANGGSGSGGTSGGSSGTGSTNTGGTGGSGSSGSGSGGSGSGGSGSGGPGGN